MRRLTDEELKNIVGGGLNLTGSLIKNILDSIELFLEIGRSFGTSIRRIANKGICSIN